MKTEGFSGADLQAFMYNAHLEVIHSSIIETSPKASSSNELGGGWLKYTALGDSRQEQVMSQADQTMFQRRVCV